MLLLSTLLIGCDAEYLEDQLDIDSGLDHGEVDGGQEGEAGGGDGTSSNAETTYADGSIPGVGTWCWTVEARDKQLALLHIALDTGAVQEVGRYGSFEEYDTSFSGLKIDGLARLGDELVMLVRDDWYVLDLTAETLTKHTETNRAFGIGADESAWYAHHFEQGILRFPTTSDLLSHAPSATVSSATILSYLDVYGDTIYTTMHAGSSVSRRDLSTGLSIGSIHLEDFDTWFAGLSITADGIHVLDDGRGAYSDRGIRLARFDRDTGALVGDLFFEGSLSAGPSGLWCEQIGS